MTRSLPAYLAPIVEELELEQASMVTMADLRRIVEARGMHTEPAKVAAGLRERGWLLATGVRGVWEFAPGAHAGPFGRGHPFRAVQAALLAAPDLAVAVCLNSALWAHGLLDSAPDRPEVAIPSHAHVPGSLKLGCRVVRFKAVLASDHLRDVPVHSLTTVLVHLAASPTDVRSWGLVMEVLPVLVAEAAMAPSRERLDEELAARPASVRARLAYLVHGVAPALAEDLFEAGHGVVWFGPRGQGMRRFHPGFQVADTLLPMAPGELRPVGAGA